jgi:hypothetical protein
MSVELPEVPVDKRGVKKYRESSGEGELEGPAALMEVVEMILEADDGEGQFGGIEDGGDHSPAFLLG